MLMECFSKKTYIYVDIIRVFMRMKYSYVRLLTKNSSIILLLLLPVLIYYEKTKFISFKCKKCEYF